MAPRASLPGELFLDAILVNEQRRLELVEDSDKDDWVQPLPHDEKTRDRVARREPYFSLRWVLNPALGIPLEPFTVWRRSSGMREPAQPIVGWHRTGHRTFGWDGITEMQLIELDVAAHTTAHGLSRADADDRAVASASGSGTIVLQGGPMVGVRLEDPGVLDAVRGLSTVTMANGSGWEPIEVVGLPLGDALAGASYYSSMGQGPTGSTTDPVNAAVERLLRWAPALGWPNLAGLPPWEPPDAARLVEELQSDMLEGLVRVLKKCPPPELTQQYLVEVSRTLPELRQLVGAKVHALGGVGDNQRSEIRIRPLQAVGTSVASDPWSSLALGFGTGAPAEGQSAKSDFMVTAPWRGWMTVAVPFPWPWPVAQPDPMLITEEAERELCAVVLSPRVRSAPTAPLPVSVEFAFAEGAPEVDKPYHCATAIRTSRAVAQAGDARVSGYGMARFDGPGSGRYAMREHPLAGGWIPVGSAVPVRGPEQVPDPELLPEIAMLRDSGVPMPISGPAVPYQYAVAATDLFGQWSHWSAGWFTVGPAAVQSPRLAVQRAVARPGPTGTDPCDLEVTVEVVWDASERRCSRMWLKVDVFDPTPAPPAPLADPPATPQPAFTAADRIVAFTEDGTPTALPAGVAVKVLHPDGSPVTAANPATGTERRYRITIPSVAVAYGAATEKAVAAYVCGEERVRPGEWSGWSHTSEVAVAPNPLPPPTPVPLPPDFPEWASLPDAAGLSYASVTWSPTGAWRYRVYEATEAALLTACGQPAPDLTAGYGVRMQALFDVHAVPANLSKIKAVYRKLGEEPVSPPVQPDGKMRFDALLPRGSSLIHCYVVAGVTETNVISSWPVPEATTGRNGFLAYAIPRPRQTGRPELLARIGPAGVPELTICVGGAVPAARIRLYRATKAALARHVGTMTVTDTVNTNPLDWKETVYADVGAPRQWNRLHYRAVALTADDPPHAGMAVDSLPSKAYALLNPPAAPPALSLTANVAGSTVAVGLVLATTDAPRATTDVGDHRLSWVVTPAVGPSTRSSTSLADLPVHTTIAALAASSDPAAYVGTDLYFRVDRAAGQTTGLTVDLTDPLGRGTHVVYTVPPHVPVPAPVLAGLAVTRAAGVVRFGVTTNVPLPPNAASDWTLRVRTRFPGVAFLPFTTRVVPFSSILAIADASQMPDPASVPDRWAIRRVEGQVLMWTRSQSALQVELRLTNPDGVSTTVQQVSP